MQYLHHDYQAFFYPSFSYGIMARMKEQQVNCLYNTSRVCNIACPLYEEIKGVQTSRVSSRKPRQLSPTPRNLERNERFGSVDGKMLAAEESGLTTKCKTLIDIFDSREEY